MGWNSLRTWLFTWKFRGFSWIIPDLHRGARRTHKRTKGALQKISKATRNGMVATQVGKQLLPRLKNGVYHYMHPTQGKKMVDKKYK